MGCIQSSSLLLRIRWAFSFWPMAGVVWWYKAELKKQHRRVRWACEWDWIITQRQAWSRYGQPRGHQATKVQVRGSLYILLRLFRNLNCYRHGSSKVLISTRLATLHMRAYSPSIAQFSFRYPLALYRQSGNYPRSESMFHPSPLWVLSLGHP